MRRHASRFPIRLLVLLPLVPLVDALNSRGIPSPDIRFTPWNALDPSTQQLAQSLDYDETSWNLPGTNPIELEAFNDLRGGDRGTARQLMGDVSQPQAVWDCFVNHYDAYTWDELVQEGLEEYMVAFGYNETSWAGNGGEIEDMLPDWEGLSLGQQRAAEEICCTQELWDGVSLDLWITPSLAPSTAPTIETPVTSVPSVEDIRYVIWKDLDNTVRENALILTYTKETWNLPGSNEIESYSFQGISNSGVDNGQQAIRDLGLTASQWDCWINHYGYYSWDSLGSVQQHLIALGWTEASWNEEAPAPKTEYVQWADLTAEQNRAARGLCYLRETWDNIDLPLWGLNVPAPTRAPTQNPTASVSATPTGAPSFAPSLYPSTSPSLLLSTKPSAQPSLLLSTKPSAQPSLVPSSIPSGALSEVPSLQPSLSVSPSVSPSTPAPSTTPPTGPPTTLVPTKLLSVMPSMIPTAQKSALPSSSQTVLPTSAPTLNKGIWLPRMVIETTGGENLDSEDIRKVVEDYLVALLSQNSRYDFLNIETEAENDGRGRTVISGLAFFIGPSKPTAEDLENLLIVHFASGTESLAAYMEAQEISVDSVDVEIEGFQTNSRATGGDGNNDDNDDNVWIIVLLVGVCAAGVIGVVLTIVLIRNRGRGSGRFVSDENSEESEENNPIPTNVNPYIPTDEESLLATESVDQSIFTTN